MYITTIASAYRSPSRGARFSTRIPPFMAAAMSGTLVKSGRWMAQRLNSTSPSRLWPPSFSYRKPEHATVRRIVLTPRRKLGRPGHQFRAVLRQCAKSRTLPVRQSGPPRTRAHRITGTQRGCLVRLAERRFARAALWLSRSRPLRARARPPLQRQQTFARSLRPAACRTAGMERCPFRLSYRKRARGPLVRPARQRARHAESRRGRRDLQLGTPRNAPQHPLGRHHHLRGPRQGPDAETRGR